jgi:SET domain-containing protein
VTRVNVMNVDIPSKFNAAVKRTQIIKQNQEKFNYTKAIEEIKGTTRVKSELLNREILTSKVNADSNATAILTTAQANSLFNALAIEKDMCRNVKNNLNGKNNEFLMNFIWVRLLEKKVTDGVDTFITMDLPSFSP